MCVIKLDIEHLTGKEAVELVRAGSNKNKKGLSIYFKSS